MQLNGSGDNPNSLGEGSYMISFSSIYLHPGLADVPADGAFKRTNGDRYRLGMNAFTDGTSSTFLFGEVDNSVIWTDGSGNPSDSFEGYKWALGYWFNNRGHVQGTFNLKQNTSETAFAEHRTFRSDHPAGVNFCMVDGSVHFINETVEPEILKHLSTRPNRIRRFAAELYVRHRQRKCLHRARTGHFGFHRNFCRQCCCPPQR